MSCRYLFGRKETILYLFSNPYDRHFALKYMGLLLVKYTLTKGKGVLSNSFFEI
ncbi:hypothetical protein J3D55_002247 [Chryseobacterium ginsenosidimutans]|nr:hypothetical protein [Chryseobacterium ginsenosidimutans]